jgi:hypothetical protein
MHPESQSLDYSRCFMQNVLGDIEVVLLKAGRNTLEPHQCITEPPLT